jgi:tRNA 2-thiouridine synthesizing protein A
MTEIKPDRVLDCSGLLCPMPLVKTNKAIKEMQVGQILEMIATDPNSMADMEAWAKQTQHDLLLAEKKEGGKSRFLIKKNR